MTYHQMLYQISSLSESTTNYKTINFWCKDGGGVYFANLDQEKQGQWTLNWLEHRTYHHQTVTSISELVKLVVQVSAKLKDQIDYCVLVKEP